MISARDAQHAVRLYESPREHCKNEYVGPHDAQMAESPAAFLHIDLVLHLDTTRDTNNFEHGMP